MYVSICLQFRKQIWIYSTYDGRLVFGECVSVLRRKAINLKTEVRLNQQALAGSGEPRFLGLLPCGEER